jgi:excisionase family DNA binding protein
VKPAMTPDGLPAEALPRFYTVGETANMLRTSAITMYRAINDGEFPAVRVRGRLIVPAKVIDALIEAAVETYSLVDAADWVPNGTGPAGSRTRMRRQERVHRPRPGANQSGAGSFSTQHVAGYGEDAMSADRAARAGGVR